MAALASQPCAWLSCRAILLHAEVCCAAPCLLPLRCPSPVGGLESLRAWLRAELFLTNFRPVPLTEHAVFRGKVYQKVAPQASRRRPAGGWARQRQAGEPGSGWQRPGHVAQLFQVESWGASWPSTACCAAAQELEALEEGHPPLQELREVAPSDSRRDADRLVPLVAEATAEGHSVLVFCSSRRQCESAAALIADLLPQVGVVHGGGDARLLHFPASSVRLAAASRPAGCPRSTLLIAAFPASCRCHHRRLRRRRRSGRRSWGSSGRGSWQTSRLPWAAPWGRS